MKKAPKVNIQRLELINFMSFKNMALDFSPHINIISGENSTGKTALIKVLYSCMKALHEANKTIDQTSKEKLEEIFVDKFRGVFRPDERMIGRLVNRVQGSNRAELNLVIGKNQSVKVAIGSRQEKHMELSINFPHIAMKDIEPVYLPPKEIISATENFGALYREYHIAFEETYNDLTLLLEKPLRRGSNTNEQNMVLQKFEEIMNGKVLQKDKKFFLKVEGAGMFEMGLVSEGYRKLATIIYLIQSGSLGANSCLFWDEPEVNMNPRMIQPLVEAIVALAQMGVQVFITTHNYFVQQSFNLIAESQQRQNQTKESLAIKFISLYKEDETICVEEADSLDSLSHNAIMEEFNALYQREQELFYDTD